jgi:RES domain-containing protein
MPLFFRICQTRHAANALSGEGSRLFGGRWNPPGLSAVYLAESRALAALEILVHSRMDVIRLNWSLVEVEVPESLIETPVSADLPAAWDIQPKSLAARSFGEEWLRNRSNVGLRLPSAVIPEENVLLLNPNSPCITEIRVSPPRRFPFDARLCEIGTRGRE